MARKISSWEEYDARVKEREEKFREEVESRLESLIGTHPLIKSNRKIAQRYRKKAQKSYILVHGIPHLINMEEIEGIERRAEEEIKRHLWEELHPTATMAIIQRQFQESLSDLVSGVISLRGSREYLTPEEKEKVYTRVTNQLYSFTAYRTSLKLKTNIPELQQLTKHYFPEQESAQRLKQIFAVLTQRKYLTYKTATSLLTLLTSECTETGKTIMPPAFSPPALLSRRSEPATAPTPTPSSLALPIPAPPAPPRATLPSSSRQEVLEYLTIMFELPPETAEKYAESITLPALEDLHDGLDTIVGKDYSLRLLQKNPHLLTYSSSDIQRYLRTLKLIKKEIGTNGNRRKNFEERFGLKNNVERYASLEQLLVLKEEFFSELGIYAAAAAGDNIMEPAEEIDITRIKLSHFPILHRSADDVERRLSLLIDNGFVTVGANEHWGETTTGARGLNILKRIKTELSHLFSALELERPVYNLNFGQRKLGISDETRQYLREIRDKAYQLQRK